MACLLGDNEIDAGTRQHFKTLKKIKSLTKEEEKSLFKRYKTYGDIGARNKLITSNLKYAITLAGKFRGMGVSYPDLISEAEEGLIKAIDRFNIDNDVKLISYSKWWMIQNMQTAIEKKKRMPESELPSDDDDDNTNDEFDDPAAQEARNNAYSTMSEFEYEEEELNDEQDKIEFLGKIMETLNDRECDMINMYYGRGYEKEFTLDEIGQKYKITKERVRQIIESSFKKIRHEALMVNSKYLYR